MPGSIAANFHEGSRSEIIADYLLSGWGTVTPVRGRDDIGVDLYCTLTERIGQRGIVTDYYVVQVKSNKEPWIFDNPDAISWLVDYPTPLFLACVDKKHGILEIFHLMPRFYLSALDKRPAKLELFPGTCDEGTDVQWDEGGTFSLSAPIIRIGLDGFMDESLLLKVRDVLTHWIRIDRDNCELLRNNLLRFRMPSKYSVNEIPHEGISEIGYAKPEPSSIAKGIVKAAEAVECIGGQLGRSYDRQAALYAALFVNHVFQKYRSSFDGHLRWRSRLPGDLGLIVNKGLNNADSQYVYQGIDDLVKEIEKLESVQEFLRNEPNA